MAALRICKQCNEAKPLDDFKRDVAARDFRRSICKTCDAAKSKAFRAKRKAALASQHHSSAPAAANDDGIQTIVVLSDVHVPEHDGLFWKAVLLWLRDHRPDELIIAGDFGEFSSVSQHGGANETKLTEDLAGVGQALDQLREAVGDSCHMTYLEGNHESRLPRATASWAPTFTGALDLPAMLELDRRGIQWVPEYAQPVQRGLLRVLHGHQVLGKYGPRHHAAKAADVYGSQPHVEIVYGHVHAAQQFSKPVAGGYVSATSAGCGRTVGADKVRWLAGREAGWHHGFVVAYVHDGVAQVFNVKVRNGKFIWNGKAYDARKAAG